MRSATELANELLAAYGRLGLSATNEQPRAFAAEPKHTTRWSHQVQSLYLARRGVATGGASSVALPVMPGNGTASCASLPRSPAPSEPVRGVAPAEAPAAVPDTVNANVSAISRASLNASARRLVGSSPSLRRRRQLGDATHMLVYLSNATWIGESGHCFAAEVRAARSLRAASCHKHRVTRPRHNLRSTFLLPSLPHRCGRHARSGYASCWRTRRTPAARAAISLASFRRRQTTSSQRASSAASPSRAMLGHTGRCHIMAAATLRCAAEHCARQLRLLRNSRV